MAEGKRAAALSDRVENPSCYKRPTAHIRANCWRSGTSARTVLEKKSRHGVVGAKVAEDPAEDLFTDVLTERQRSTTTKSATPTFSSRSPESSTSLSRRKNTPTRSRGTDRRSGLRSIRAPRPRRLSRNRRGKTSGLQGLPEPARAEQAVRRRASKASVSATNERIRLAVSPTWAAPPIRRPGTFPTLPVLRQRSRGDAASKNYSGSPQQ